MDNKFKLAMILAAIVAHDVHTQIKARKFRCLAFQANNELIDIVINQAGHIEHLYDVINKPEDSVDEFDRIVRDFYNQEQD